MEKNAKASEVGRNTHSISLSYMERITKFCRETQKERIAKSKINKEKREREKEVPIMKKKKKKNLRRLAMMAQIQQTKNCR